MSFEAITSEPIKVFLYLGIALISARIMGEIFERLKLSSIIGELLAGILFGGPFLGMIGSNPKMFVDIDVLKQFSQIGIIILLFIVGLEINPKNIAKTGKKCTLLSIVAVAFALLGGFLTGYFIIKLTITQSLFFGTMFTATSIGVTVRTLNDLGRLNSKEGEILLSTAIFDDFIALFLVLIFSYILLPTSGRAWYLALLINIGILAAFLIGLIFILPLILKFLENRLRIFSSSISNYFTIGIIFGILALLVYSAELLGISGAIIAFLFGLSIQSNKILVGDIKETFVKMGEGLFLPLFFFGVGATFIFDFSDFSPLLLIVIPIAIISKGIGTFTGSSIIKLKPAESFRITLGMMPQAEIVLVIAEIGLIQGIFTQSIYSVAVLMVFITVIITPLALRLAFRKQEPTIPCADVSQKDQDKGEKNVEVNIESS
ncbi:MAG: cation:proton antiporter [Candidatus Heimdallarchaeota archaeon]|nr:cation:proton antiporter [Candidatus Heimdallarchaeota archaeon]